MIPNQSFYKYSPTSQGLPTEALAQSLALGAQEADTNLAEYNKQRLFEASIVALPGDKDYVVNTIKQAAAPLDYMAKQTKDLQRWDLARTAVNNRALAVAADPKILAAVESYKNFQQGEAEKQKLRDAGHTPLEFSDPTKHRSFDDQGNVNIYRPVIEVKGDYIGEAAKLWNTLAPELISANLTHSDVQGILEGKIIKGITTEMVRSKLALVEQSYMSSDSGMQQKKLYSYNGKKNPDKDISSFLLGIGLLKTHKDTAVNYTPDPEYRAEQEMNKVIAKAQYSAAAKKAKGRPEYSEDADKWFSRRVTTATAGVSGKDRAIVIGINNANLIDGLSSTLEIPSKDTFKFVGTDSKNEDMSDVIITDTPRVIGIISTNAHTAEYRGGYYANLPYKTSEKGPTKMATIIMKNGNEGIKERVNTLAHIEDIIAKPKVANSAQGYVVHDDSGLLMNAQSQLNEIAVGNGYDIDSSKLGFVVRPSGDKITGTVQPVLYPKNSKTSKELTKQQLYDLGLKSSYTIDDIYGMTQDKLVQDFSIYAETKASLQKQVPDATSN